MAEWRAYPRHPELLNGLQEGVCICLRVHHEVQIGRRQTHQPLHCQVSTFTQVVHRPCKTAAQSKVSKGQT